MAEIDAAVVMPRGALPLGKYARYYADRPDGKIAVFYTAYVQEPRRADYMCAEVTENFALNEQPCAPPDEPKAGSRHWVGLDHMPDANDGGCWIINLIYNPATHRAEETKCNGPM